MQLSALIEDRSSIAVTRQSREMVYTQDELTDYAQEVTASRYELCYFLTLT